MHYTTSTAVLARESKWYSESFSCSLASIAIDKYM